MSEAPRGKSARSGGTVKTAGFIVALFAASMFSAGGVPADDTIHSGTVIYTKNAGNYTYIRLMEEGKKVWLATTPLQVSVGDPVEYTGGDVMEKFESKAMKKTFDEIRFVTRIRVVKDGSAPDNQATASIAAYPTGGPKGGLTEGAKDAPKKSPVVAVPQKGEVKKAEKGKTVEEIFAGREQLKDRPVTLRGKVIKASRNILKKNWITLSDGTGTAPDDRIVAVTTDYVASGVTATVKGVVRTNVNLGGGYKYMVLIDEAEFAN